MVRLAWTYPGVARAQIPYVSLHLVTPIAILDGIIGIGILENREIQVTVGSVPTLWEMGALAMASTLVQPIAYGPPMPTVSLLVPLPGSIGPASLSVIPYWFIQVFIAGIFLAKFVQTIR